MQHLVSIIMPAYNAERYVADAVRSVLGQTCGDWELVVVDDGSKDGTAEVVRGLAARDARIRLVERENGGQAAARNTGIRASHGTLVAFLDADDLWVGEKLELQLGALEETGADVLSSNGFVFLGDDSSVEAYELATAPGRTEGAEMFKLLYAFNRIQIQSVVVRRGWLEKVGLFDEDRRYQNCEDYDLWLSLAAAGAVFYGMEEKLIKYRRHSTASTHEESNVLRPMVEVMKKHGRNPALGEKVVRTRIRDLYRSLAEALVREGKLAEAARCLEEFAAWEGSAVTRAQRVVLRLWPRGFNFISRECLFRVEWHLNRVLGR
jgi:teichuronic acid biosynthesis glycosyltransferase TuaG